MDTTEIESFLKDLRILIGLPAEAGTADVLSRVGETVAAPQGAYENAASTYRDVAMVVPPATETETYG